MSDAVGLAIVDRVPEGVARTPAPANHCTLVGRARHGDAVWACAEDIRCPIARYILGCDSSQEAINAAAASFVDSRLAATADAARRFVEGFRPLEPRPRVFVYFPACAAPVPADVVVFFLRPDEAMRRLRALVTATGERAEVRTAGAAAMCGDCTASPLLSGRAVLSPGCPGCRREVPLAADEMLFALPSHLARAVHAQAS